MPNLKHLLLVVAVLGGCSTAMEIDPGFGAEQPIEAPRDASVMGSAMDARVAPTPGGDPLDPSLRGSRCLAGHYSGSFSAAELVLPGPIGALLGSPKLNAGDAGAKETLAFDLAPSLAWEGAAYEANNGVVNGYLTFSSGSFAVLMSGTMQGSIDCATGRFQGQLQMGTPPTPFGTSPVEGPLTATYDPASREFISGVYSLRAVDGGVNSSAAQGSWSAVYQRP